MRAWLAFIVTFAVLRFITYGIRYHFLPLQNITSASGAHLHHFVWGIAILIIVGFLGLMVEEATWHPRFAVLFGVGVGLIVDELVIIVTFQDLYWSDAGQVSVDVALLLIGGAGLYFAASRFWRAVVREVRVALAAAWHRRRGRDRGQDGAAGVADADHAVARKG